MVFPARGEVAYVVPGFEEMRARELIRFGKDVRIWEEDESPGAKVAQIFKDRGIVTGRIGIEEGVRFFLFDGIRKQAPASLSASLSGRLFRIRELRLNRWPEWLVEGRGSSSAPTSGRIK